MPHQPTLGVKITPLPDSCNKAAELCQIVNARHFLPYAHWWNDIGASGGDEESELLAELTGELARLGISTKTAPWNIGDMCTISPAHISG